MPRSDGNAAGVVTIEDYYIQELQDRVGWNVFNYYASCSNDASVANGNSWAYCYAASKPTVFSNGDRRASFNGLTAFYIVYRVIGSQELAIRAYLGYLSLW